MGIAELGSEVFGGGSETFIVEYLGEGHIDVQVVLFKRVRDAIGLLGWKVGVVDFGVALELGGCAETHADHLSRPIPGDAIPEFGKRDRPGTIEPVPRRPESRTRRRVDRKLDRHGCRSSYIRI